MQLEIYQISHPLIKIILSSLDIKYISEIDKHRYERYLGFLIIYEILRKYILIKNIYIKLLEETKQINMIDNDRKYIILTNTSKTYNMISEISCITPNLEIIHTEYENKHKIQDYIEKISLYKQEYSIFILEKITKNYQILNLLDFLIKDSNITINQVSICNILSCSQLLNKIGQKYPKLKIYTTKIQ
uniref:Uracil phosphoribosyltransferase n=1 Tax=Kapraunia schneideri TaxID=717899 RepID=A0A1Z1MSD2_9FLOR|nr:uracil phosphoribosyltransferase [Kapraunia schneideri]ARW69013.1 uracil phosphoribosyltransferase [Kapraunia schneideri]